MRKKHKTGLMGVIVLLLMGISIFCLGHQEVAMAAGANLEGTKLTIGIPAPSPSFFPNYVAKTNGFYEEEGVTETKILAFRGNAPTVQALASGTIDIAVASLHGLINTIKSGQKFKGIWAGYNMTFFEWYSQPKYKSIADTKGASYGVQITMDRPEPGGSSGAELREGISWGKMEEEGKFVDVICDITIALPLIAASLKERLSPN